MVGLLQILLQCQAPPVKFRRNLLENLKNMMRLSDYLIEEYGKCTKVLKFWESILGLKRFGRMTRYCVYVQRFISISLAKLNGNSNYKNISYF